MADRDDLEFTYSLIDRIFRLSLGELADFSGAKYDGDFTLSLDEAQRRKHEYMAEQIGITPGRRVLDLGCGWGPLLDFVRSRGATGVGRHPVLGAGGLLPAPGARCPPPGRAPPHARHLRSVRRRGQPRRLRALCSPEEHEGGRQDDIYRGLFARLASLLPSNGRVYLQTMVFGRNMIPLDQIASGLRATPTPGTWP